MSETGRRDMREFWRDGGPKMCIRDRLYIPYGDSERYTHYRNESVTLRFAPGDDDVSTDIEWQVASGGNRVSVTRNDDETFTITARTNSLGSSESRATVVIRARSAHDHNIMGTYNIGLARGIAKLDVKDIWVDYDTTTTFTVQQPGISPSNATFRSRSDFVFMSSDPSIVSIDENGVCTVHNTGIVYVSMCPKYDCGYINGGSPDVTAGFTITVLKKAKQVVIAMVSDDFDEIISVNEGVAPHGGLSLIHI